MSQNARPRQEPTVVPERRLGEVRDHEATVGRLELAGEPDEHPIPVESMNVIPEQSKMTSPLLAWMCTARRVSSWGALAMSISPSTTKELSAGNDGGVSAGELIRPPLTSGRPTAAVYPVIHMLSDQYRSVEGDWRASRRLTPKRSSAPTYSSPMRRSIGRDTRREKELA